MIKRIAILGSGAIGSVVGGMLAKAGHDVTLIDQWPDHVEAMKKIGLRLSGTVGEHVVPRLREHAADHRPDGARAENRDPLDHAPECNTGAEGG